MPSPPRPAASRHKKQRLFPIDKETAWIFGSILMSGVIALLASFVLSVEALTLAENANADLPCSINAVLNCATVSLHPSAHIFGFPNSFLGMITEPVVITMAVAMLLGARFPRPFMFLAQLGFTAGFGFSLWLFYTSYFVIGALCPWCLLVLLMTTMAFFALIRYNIREYNLFLPARFSWLKPYVQKDFDLAVFVGFVTCVVAAILLKYGAELFS